MQNHLNPPCTFLYIGSQHTIPKHQDFEDEPEDVISLSNEKCIIKYAKMLLQIDLKRSMNYKHQFINIQSKGEKILPSIDAGFCVFCSWMYIRYDQEKIGKAMSIGKTKILCSDTIYFHQSSEIYALIDDKNRQTFKNIRGEDKAIISNYQGFYGLADEQELAIVEVQQKRIKILNLKNQQQIQLFLPEVYFKQTYSKQRINLYLINREKVIIGIIKQEIFYLLLVDLVKSQTTQLLRMNNIIECQFNTLNKKYNTIMFSYAEMHAKTILYKMTLFNWNNRTLVWNKQLENFQIDWSTKLSDPKKRMSPNLDHYVSLQRTNNQINLIHFRHPQLRKVYMSIYKKSLLSQNYSDKLIRAVLQIIT